MIVQISTALHKRLLALAAADPVREICGLLLGRDDVVEAFVETANTAADPTTTFEIEPRSYITAIKAARSGGLPMIGCYHSHPGGSAEPSIRDLEMAETGSLWLIIAKDEIKGWRRGKTQFDEVRIVVAP